jgi:hypothetical protein
MRRLLTVPSVLGIGPQGRDLPIIPGCVLPVCGMDLSQRVRSRRSPAAVRGPSKVHARYICALIWHYLACQEGWSPRQREADARVATHGPGGGMA